MYYMCDQIVTLLDRNMRVESFPPPLSFFASRVWARCKKKKANLVGSGDSNSGIPPPLVF